MPLDPDTRFALVASPVGGALGSFCERMVTYLSEVTKLGPSAQYAFLHDKTVEIMIYILVASIITTSGILLFPINRQNRPQLIGTAIVFGMIWPSVLDRLLHIAGNTITS